MLSHWLERGLGQVVAPDPSKPDDDDAAAAAAATNETQGGIWDDFFAVVA
eukprot:CAMPEP_0197440754 /NCGR_PEP_ID=MMETSP1175-20131217/7179_1 /TAXON_ID=1003142 /ORGANISM="Triceratium dubium, Strain CCMP147" /LENGTH=49 /DNA_ID= /DNA_START= /DNA_END= /DNA_ORIENTATION=